MNIKRLFIISGSILLGLTIILIWLLFMPPILTRAASYTVCTAGPPTCDYSSVQSAVDAAGDGDVIKVAAGTYTGINNKGGHAQVVYIDKSVTIRGGYTTSNWTTFDPVANPSTLDAQGGGRVLYITGNVSPTIEGLRITGGDASVIGIDEGGGGVSTWGSDVILRNNSIVSNTAKSGGGVFMWQCDNAVLKGNTISHNDGGGVWSMGGDDITIRDNTISDNNHVDWGGGLNLSGNGIMVTRNTITFNTASDHGGGLSLNGDIEVIGNNISNNSGVNGGGGIVLGGGNPALTKNIIANNQGELGGGVQAFWCNPIFYGNTFSENSAMYGGGMMVSENTTLNYNTFISNTAEFHGGGLWLRGGTLNGNTFSSNSASVGGGVILFESDATLTNNLIFNNQANETGIGSGITIWSSTPHLVHNTIAGNSGGDGSGIIISDSTVTLTNTIIANHVVGILVNSGATASLEATLWGDGAWANDTDWAGEGTINTINDIWGDPDFVDPENDDYHIGPDSAAIDHGVDAGVTNDIDHHPRPYQEPDIGVDEYWPPGALKFIYLPVITR